MNPLLLLLAREFRVAARRRWLRSPRLLAVGLPALLLLFTYLLKGAGGGADGLALLQRLTPCVLLIATLVTPLMAGGLLRREIEQQTLPALVLTDLGLARIFASKVGAVGVTAGLLVLGTLPLMLLCVSLGGVEATQMAAWLALVLSVLVWGIGVGLWLAALRRGGPGLPLVVLLATIAWLLLPLLVRVVMEAVSEQVSGATADLLWLGSSALAAGNSLGRGGVAPGLWLCCGVHLALGLAAAAASFPLVRRVALDEPAWSWRWWQRAGTARPPSRPRVGRHAVFWREYYCHHGGWRRMVGAAVVIAAVLAAMVVLMGEPRHALDAWVAWLEALGAALMVAGLCLYPLGLLYSGATSLARERQQRTAEMLLLSGLEAEEVVRQTRTAIYVAWLPFLLLAVPGLAACLVEIWPRLGSNGDTMLPLAIVIYGTAYLGLVYCLPDLALYGGLRFHPVLVILVLLLTVPLSMACCCLPALGVLMAAIACKRYLPLRLWQHLIPGLTDVNPVSPRAAYQPRMPPFTPRGDAPP